MRLKFLSILFCLTLLSSTAYASSARVVAVVNGEMISSYDLEQEIIPVLFSMGINPKSEKNKAEIQRIEAEVLRKMVEEQVLLQEAAKQGIVVNDEFVEQELVARISSTKLSKEAFFKEAAKHGMTEKLMKEDIKTGMILQQLVSRNVMQKILVTEDEVVEYFNTHPDLGSIVTAYQVGLMVYPDEATAKKYAQQIEDGKISFAAAVKKVSVGPNTSNSGDMGMTEAGDLAPGLLQIVSTLKVGETSSILQLGPQSAQIHLIDVKATEGDKVLNSQMQEQIKQAIREPKFQIAYEEYLTKLHDKAIIDIRY